MEQVPLTLVLMLLLVIPQPRLVASSSFGSIPPCQHRQRFSIMQLQLLASKPAQPRSSPDGPHHAPLHQCSVKELATLGFFFSETGCVPTKNPKEVKLLTSVLVPKPCF